MFLHRIHVNPRNRRAQRRDLASPYEMHRTLSRVFAKSPNVRIPPGTFLWRLEPEKMNHPETGIPYAPRVLIQSGIADPKWSALDEWGKDWLFLEPEPPVDLNERLRLNQLRPGTWFRFRLRGNPCQARKPESEGVVSGQSGKRPRGKRVALYLPEEQRKWLARIGVLHGFSLADPERAMRIIDDRMLTGEKRVTDTPEINKVRVFSALFEGILRVEDPETFRRALAEGVGHGKAMGLGLLSVIPAAFWE